MENELKKIPDIFNKLYPVSGTTTPYLLQDMSASMEQKIKTAVEPYVGPSKRIRRIYPDTYWEEGCPSKEGGYHISCTIGDCRKQFHSKFELKYHKKTAHAY